MLREELEINRFIPHKESQKRLESYIDFYVKYRKKYFPLNIIEPRDRLRQSLRLPPSKQWKNIRYVVEDGDKIIATGFVGYSIGEINTNPDFAEIHITVDPEYTGRGIAKGLLGVLVDKAKELGKTKYHTYINTQDSSGIGRMWLEKVKAKKTIEECDNRLMRENINWEYIRESIDKLEEKLSMYQFIRMGKDEYLDRVEKDDNFARELADYLTEVQNLIPRGESSWNDTVVTINDLRSDIEKSRKVNWDAVKIYVFDNKKIIAHTETYHWKEEKVPFAETGMTAVRKEYQRKGIATFLKAKITSHLFSTYPEMKFIETENAETNNAMLKINWKLGYREIARWIEYEGKVEDLYRYLQS